MYMYMYVYVYMYIYVYEYMCDTAQGKDAPRGNFLMLYAEYLRRYDTI